MGWQAIDGLDTQRTGIGYGHTGSEEEEDHRGQTEATDQIAQHRRLWNGQLSGHCRHPGPAAQRQSQRFRSEYRRRARAQTR